VYIRWIVRKHKNTQALHMKFHDAYLTYSYRNRHGKPRQHTVAYLGSLREINDKFPAIERELFLLRAGQILNSLPDLPIGEHESIWRLLQKVAHPLSRQEVTEAFHQNLRWYLQTCQIHGYLIPTANEINQLIEEIQNTQNSSKERDA
jgi:hypothetical protein